MTEVARVRQFGFGEAELDRRAVPRWRSTNGSTTT
jgi:hypothetical protein